MTLISIHKHKERNSSS